jgi:methionyl-tRNA synthetase
VRAIEQFYDPVKNMFLPDRFIKGECPKCGAKDQYGDACESCGAAYAPTELKNPYSAVSGAQPVLKSSDHYFFKLADPRCQEFLRRATREVCKAQPEAVNKLQEWLGEPGENKLTDWDISRDAPYFGFEIPDAPGKFFYVWLDAPIGYMGSFKNFCARKGLDFDEFWGKDSKAELHHFVGKDILYFHALFWPAELEFAGYRTPTNVFAHGFLTVDGAKMSKSRGTFITAESYLAQGLNPEWLRYYFAAKLNGTMEDIDLNLDDFTPARQFRPGRQVHQHRQPRRRLHRQALRRQAAAQPHQRALPVELPGIMEAAEEIAGHYEARDTARALRRVMALADQINQYVDKTSRGRWPSRRARTPTARGLLAADQRLPPADHLPQAGAAQAGAARRGIPQRRAAALGRRRPPAAAGHLINAYEHLMQRIDPKQIDALIAANRESLEPAVAVTAAEAPAPSQQSRAHSPQRHAQHQQATEDKTAGPGQPLPEQHISIDDFGKVDLRIARIADAQHVEGADKLIR